MEIISITRVVKDTGLPATLMIGESLVQNGTPTDNDPVVKSIKFFETSAFYAKVCRGPFYVVKFEEDSKVSELIPLDKVLDVVVATKKVEPTKLPELPEVGEAK